MQCSSVMLSSFEMKCTTDIENLKYFISENSKTIPDLFFFKLKIYVSHVHCVTLY